MEFKKKFVVNFCFFSSIVLIILAFGNYILPILTPFILGFAVAAVAHIPMKFIRVKHPRSRRMLASAFCLLFFLILAAVLTLFGAGIVSELRNTIQNLPEWFRTSIYPLFREIATHISKVLSPIDPELTEWILDLGKTVTSSLAKLATDFSAGAVKAVASSAVSIPNLIIQIIIVVVSAFYIAADYDQVLSFLIGLLPEGKQQVALDTIRYAKTAILVYIKSYSILFLMTFLELLIGLLILRIPYAWSIAFGIALFDLMPILGTGGILLPWAAILLILGNYSLAVGILILYIIITAVRNTVEPRIIGDQIGLHPLATLIAMAVGLGLLGLLGMLLFPVALVAFTNLRKNRQEPPAVQDSTTDQKES